MERNLQPAPPQLLLPVTGLGVRLWLVFYSHHKRMAFPLDLSEPSSQQPENIKDRCERILHQ